MSRRDPADWSLEDVQRAICAPHGCTLMQIQALDFPPADYVVAGEHYWSSITVDTWLGLFHQGLLSIEKADRPENFAQFVDAILGPARG